MLILGCSLNQFSMYISTLWHFYLIFMRHFALCILLQSLDLTRFFPCLWIDRQYGILDRGLRHEKNSKGRFRSQKDILHYTSRNCSHWYTYRIMFSWCDEQSGRGKYVRLTPLLFNIAVYGVYWVKEAAICVVTLINRTIPDDKVDYMKYLDRSRAESNEHITILTSLTQVLLYILALIF
jgi:hypothetical protein